jgi:hypothetical protein
MAVERSFKAGTANLDEKAKEAAEGKRVLVQPFLPETSASSYINIPPGEIREVNLVGTDPLGEDAENIKRIHETKLLTCRVTGISTLNDPITSDPVDFSQEIKYDRTRLQKLGPSRSALLDKF